MSDRATLEFRYAAAEVGKELTPSQAEEALFLLSEAWREALSNPQTTASRRYGLLVGQADRLFLVEHLARCCLEESPSRMADLAENGFLTRVYPALMTRASVWAFIEGREIQC